jgi:transcriptional regulator with XRE-family HTH domain
MVEPTKTRMKGQTQVMTRNRVAEVAQARGLNASKLSRRSDLSLRTVLDVWHNTRDPRLSTLDRIAQTLGVKTIELLVEDDGDR